MSNIVWNGETPMVGDVGVNGNSVGDTVITLPPGEFTLLSPIFFNPVGTVSVSVFELRTEANGNGASLFSQALSGLTANTVISVANIDQRKVSGLLYLRNTVGNGVPLDVDFQTVLLPIIGS